VLSLQSLPSAARPSTQELRVNAHGFSLHAAVLLGVKQPEISALMRAKFSRFSQERLIGFLNKLDRKVTIQISRHRGKEPYQQVTLAP